MRKAAFGQIVMLFPGKQLYIEYQALDEVMVFCNGNFQVMVVLVDGAPTRPYWYNWYLGWQTEYYVTVGVL